MQTPALAPPQPTAKAMLGRSQRLKLRRDFLAKLDSVEPFQQLFDHLPGTFFFIKDTQGRLVYASRPVLQHLGVAHEADFPGTTDYDYFPRHIADNFVRDDQRVMRTRQPLLNHVEIWYNEQHILEWFVTNKLPLLDRRKRVTGVIGTLHKYSGTQNAQLPFAGISKAVEHIRHKLHDPISVKELAAISHVSPRQLHRRFRLAFGIGAQQFLTKTRVQAACDALVRTERTLADIAVSCGYCDQSAFTHQFRRLMGVTPRRYRQRYQGIPIEPVPAASHGM
jgi:AraC-like DNA-binding protein